MKTAKEATIGASELKAHCSRLLDEVSADGRTYVITKRGRPVAKLVPIAAHAAKLGGLWEGRARTIGDIVHCDWTDEWEAAR